MANQPLTKLAKLTEQFPSIARTRTHFMWRPSEHAKLRYPVTHVSVQKADPDLMQFQGKNTGHRTYVTNRSNSLRGERHQFFFAYDERGNPLGDSLTWYTEDSRNDFAKDIFAKVEPSKVAYVTIETVYTWHKPTPEFSEEVFQPEIEGVEVNIIVYPKPKNMTWVELVVLSEKIKKEQENAWRFNPKVMPKLAGIHLALKKGFKLHAFSSGGGLRVVSLNSPSGNEKAYGEHPHVEEALNHLDEDFLAGGRSYEEMYGPKGLYTHYLTGSTLPTSNIDNWLRHGSKFDAWQDGDEVVFQLSGYKHQEMPKNIQEKAKKNPGRSFTWKDRDFFFRGSYQPNMFGSGKGGYTWRCLNPEENSCRDTFYNITKTGKGKTMWQAMRAAFRAEEIEDLKNK